MLDPTTGPDPTSQQAEGNPAHDDPAGPLNSYMEFLSDDLLFGSEGLDPATLEAVCQLGLPAASTIPGGGTAPTDRPSAPGAAKRAFEDDSDSDDDDDGRPGPSGGGDSADKGQGRRGKSEMTAAATKKACREKARREKLNERFIDLAKLVDPSNEPKTDKTTILTDAIKYVQQITVENHQLKQLNKFLEERVGSMERERGQQLYQQSLLLQQHMMQQPMQGLMAPLLAGPPNPVSIVAGVGVLGGAAQSALLAPAATSAAFMSAAPGPLLSSSSGQAPVPSSATPPPLPPLPPQPALAAQPQQQQQLAQPAQQSQPVAAALPINVSSASAMGSTALRSYAALAAAGAGKPLLMAGHTNALPYPGMYWLPPQALDSKQDSLLRPPAA